MSKRIDTIWHLFLYFALTMGAIAGYLVRFDAKQQFIILMMLTSFYMIWGVCYHHVKKDTTIKILLEYSAISFIALAAGYLVLVG